MYNPGGVDFQLHVNIEGHPSGVGLLLLPLPRGETRATGRPAHKAGRILLITPSMGPGLVVVKPSRLEIPVTALTTTNKHPKQHRSRHPIFQ